MTAINAQNLKDAIIELGIESGDPIENLIMHHKVNPPVVKLMHAPKDYVPETSVTVYGLTHAVELFSQLEQAGFDVRLDTMGQGMVSYLLTANCTAVMMRVHSEVCAVRIEW